MDFYAYSSEEDDMGSQFVLHNAAEAGDVELLRSLLEKKPSPADVPNAEGDPTLLAVPLESVLSKQPEYDVDQRDEDNCTPLHLAILHGHANCVEVLLQNGASATKKCEGSAPLHIAVCAGSHPDRQHATPLILRLLLAEGAVAYDRDDHGRTGLHWAAYLGLTSAIDVLLESAKEFAAAQAAQNAAAVAENGDADAAAANGLPPLIEFQDRQGNTALHLAARYCQPQALAALLHEVHDSGAAEFCRVKNKGGGNVLHMAAVGGNPECVRLVAEAAPYLLSTVNRQGLNAAALAAKRGHPPSVVQLLTAGGAKGEQQTSNAAANSTHPPNTIGVPAKTRPPKPAFKSYQTALLAPPECFNHHTAPWPFMRGMPPPPPENVDRLTVLTRPGVGILRTSSFEGKLLWDEKPRRAPLGDILRVHDWAYVRKIQSFCEKIPDSTATVSHLDGDTAVSTGTYAAALAAAGAVTHAVDEILQGKVRNAFCAVRPPGHHAGPSGVVTCGKDPHGSHGFCLFNNVAIGAAYAMTVHRHAGIKKTAILDFDVHHGNGTEACVANTAPSIEKFAFKTPYSEGVQQFPIYKPWHDVDDKDNVFFASVQGYGPKAAGVAAYVYPGSGATCDTRDPHGPRPGGIAADLAVVRDDSAGNGDLDLDDGALEVEEDPDAEFVYHGGEMPRSEGPRIIDVGIPGPGHKVALWRRSWRDKIIPALVKFDPDFIFISAGFDAHKKDDINFNYIGIQEKDYEWLTDQLVQVANRCCEGRIVSVLEGGYRIQGAVVSAFARSVAAHVHAMAEENVQVWDPKDAKWEREHEKALRAEAEAKRAAALAADWAKAQTAIATAAAAQAEHEAPNNDATAPAVPPVVGAATGESGGATTTATAAVVKGEDVEMEDGDDAGRRKRRRSNTAVDYVALNKKLEEEAKAKAAGQ